jgi:hypothetical protein
VKEAVGLRVGVTRSKEMDEVVGRVSPVHVESEETTVFATRAVEALKSHSVVIENGAVASQKIRYVVGDECGGRKAERIHVKRCVRCRLNIDR